ncbi:MAG: hypothetical protein LBC74_13505 [Planctomycetaceae bacterium]|nr:hypothetical protein [Planctomycetaceae bacterium]
MNKNTPPSDANNFPPSEGSGVVSYRLAKRSIIDLWIFSRGEILFFCSVKDGILVKP